MPKPRLPFLHRHTKRGKEKYYVKLDWNAPGRGLRIEGKYRGEEFMAAYLAAVRGAPIVPASLPKGSKGTLGWLITQYRHSRAWCEYPGIGLSPATRKQRGPILAHVEDTAGDIPYKSVTRAKIEEGISERTQNQGRHFFDTVRGLFKWAVDNEHHDKNPTDGIKVVKNNGNGHLAWPIECIEQFEKHWPIGTPQRLAFDVLLYVGLRRGDAARLGKQHMPRGIVHLMTEKSQGKTPIFVPINPALAASIKACPSKGLAIIAKPDGTNYNKEAFGNFFRDAIVAAGIPTTKKGSKVKGYSAHGLRKACAVIFSESGATGDELNAIFGWTGHEMALLYTRAADRKRLAARAMTKWVRPSSDDAVVGETVLEFLQLEKEQA